MKAAGCVATADDLACDDLGEGGCTGFDTLPCVTGQNGFRFATFYCCP